MFRLPMETLFAFLNRRFLIVDNGSKHSSLLILLENLALVPPFPTLSFVTLHIFKYFGLARLSEHRPRSFLGISLKNSTLPICDPLKNHLNN